MSILDKVIKLKPKAPRITVFSKPGVGKSTLAASFPNPLFILTEETGLVGVSAFDVATTFQEVWDHVTQLLALPEIPYKTIVLDSISKFDALVVQYILENEKPDKNGNKATTLNTACGGYGAGALRAQSLHRAFKAKMDKLQERGITCIYIAHCGVSKIKSPDSEDYDVFSIEMSNDKCKVPYIDDVDFCGFCRLRSFTTETDSGRTIVKSTDERVIITGVNDAHVSKNRFAMPNEIAMNFESIKKYIPFYNQQLQIQPQTKEKSK